MKLKQSVCSWMVLCLFIVPLSLKADVDFEWRLSLNNRYHSDPYGYRYGLVDRFHLPESRVVVILDSVRDPADAYMIFRLAELSGKSYHHVLSVYRQNRYASWLEVAALVGIVMNSRDFNDLKHRHDLRDDHHFDNRRISRYEDKRVMMKREEHYNPHVYKEQQKMHHEPEPKRRQQDDSRDDEKPKGRGY